MGLQDTPVQALRWRMDWSSIDHDKEEAVLSYSICDILGLDDPDDKTLLMLFHPDC